MSTHITELVNGTELKPGTPYYMRVRYRDIVGNLSESSVATSMVLRYTDQNPGARIFRRMPDGDPGTWFQRQNWTAYPFIGTATVQSGYYDVWGNANLMSAAQATGTLAFLTDSPVTASYFRMPCDGMCRINARVGVWNDATSKADVPVAFGVMRIGSANLAGGNASTPVVPFNTTAHIANRALSGGLFAGPTTMYVGSTISSLFVSITADVSARSGDYLCIGVFPEDHGIQPAVGIGASSGSVSFAHFVVIQD